MATPSAFGRYQIKDKLGRGGMAQVYLAYDPRFEREVALKLLPHELMYAPAIRARFEREARTVAALDHPAIVPVYDFGEQDGQLYLVMRYMAGGSLGDRLETGPLSLEETGRIVSRIAPALDEAHQKGVIHRDIKPGNILFDHRNAPALADFGIVRLTESTAGLTGSGWVGTPAFMAPEMGDPGGVTPLVDIYALGVTVYMMLSGQHPYEADTPSAYIVAHVSKPVPDILSVRPDLPLDTQAVIEQAMAKNPADRYQSAGALADGLREAAVQEPLPAPTVEEATLIKPPVEPTIEEAVLSPAAPGAQEMTLPDAPSAGPTIQEPSPVVESEAPLTDTQPGEMTADGPAFSQPLKPPRPEPGATATVPARRTWIWVALGVVVVLGLAFAFWPREGKTPTDIRETAEAGVSHNADWTPYTETINGVEMALVPAGCFQMGSEAGNNIESPVHEVCFEEPFWIDVYEVTNAQFAEFGGVAGRESHWTEGDRPRERINWTEAAAFCELRGARLPTEAEWEYAARGPDSLVYPWGNDFIADNAVYADNSDRQTWDVGSKPGGVSWVGVYDLSGNVWEWVNDWYDEGYYAALADGAVNPQGSADSANGRVQRGGSWSNSSVVVRAAVRLWNDPSVGSDNFGFRCALSYNADS